MPIVDVHNTKKEKVAEITLSDAIFDIPVREDILHEVVTMQLANRRAGTASTKTRSEVSGGGRKPWRQKGTGRARAGSNTSPLFKRGGTVFGPAPRDYGYKVPRKVRKLALRMALSDRMKSGQFLIVEEFAVSEIKTKKLLEVLDTLGTRDVLIVTDGRQDNLEKSARNVPGVDVIPSAALNVYDILLHESLILSKECIARIEESLRS